MGRVSRVVRHLGPSAPPGTTWSGSYLHVPAAVVTIGVTVCLLRLSAPGRAVAVAALVAAVAAGAVVAIAGSASLARFLFMTAVVLLPLNGIRSGGMTASDGALVGAVVLSVLDPGTFRRRLVLPQRFIVGAYIFTIAGLMGTVVAQGAGVGNFARLLGTMVAAVVGVLLWQPDLDQVRKLAWGWLAGSAINVAVALASMGALDPGRRPDGLTTHPNALGLTCAMSIGFALFVRSVSAGRSRKLISWSVAAALVGVAVSGSRAAVLAAAVILLAQVLVAGRPATKAIAVFGAVAAALVAGPLSTRLPDSSALSRLIRPTSGVSQSNADRLGKFRESLAAIEARPWTGGGFASANYGHDLALQVAVSAGLVGLGGFVLACVPMVSALWQNSGDWRMLTLPALGFFAGSLFSNNLWDRYVWFALGLGMLAHVRARAVAEPVDSGDIGIPSAGDATYCAEPARPGITLC